VARVSETSTLTAAQLLKSKPHATTDSALTRFTLAFQVTYWGDTEEKL
jgi:hypothetical protein